MDLTRSGLPAVGDIPWGMHFCQFYRTPDDLVDALVSFFKAGLEGNEQCLWVASEPLRRDDALAALRASVPDLEQRLTQGQIEVLDSPGWYTRQGGRGADAVLDDWLAREARALRRGYAGLRVSGNTCWIETREQRRGCAEHEAKVNACFGDHRIVALCSYCLDRCSAADTLDVVRNHHFAIVRPSDHGQSGHWEMVESASLRMAREQLRSANEQLERRVRERTAELHERERRYHQVLEALPSAIYTTDAAGYLTYFNQAAVELAGRRPALGHDQWCVTWRLYHPDGTPMPHNQCPMAATLRSNRAVKGAEIVVERSDGARVPVMAHPTPLRDASGALVGAVNMLVDISKRKRAETLAECQKRALQMLGQGAPLDEVLGFLVRMAERQAGNGMLGSILLLNDAGTHFERGIGASLPEAFNAAVAGVAVSSAIGVCCHAVSRGEPVVVRDFSADPQWARFAAFVAPYGLRAGWSVPILGSDGKALGTFANYYRDPCDPTPSDLQWVEIVRRTAAIAIERKRAEEELRQREEWQRTLIASSPLAIVVIDADADVRLWTPAAERLFGWTAAEVLGRRVPFIPADRLPECVSCRETAMRGEVFGLQTRRSRRDGSLVDVSMTAAPLRDASGAITRILVLFEDDTDRKRAEETLRQSEERLRRLNQDLESRVREEVAAREAAQARLAQAQRMEALGQLAGGIAHDFNNVLQAVSGGARLIERRATDAETVRRLTAMMAEAAERGASVTRRLLAFSRRDELRAEPVDAAALLDDLREVLAHTLGARISIRIEAADGLPLLLADKGQLETVLINLATNARDAMPDGGTLTLSAAAEQVGEGRDHEAGLPAGAYVRLAVIDVGTGMDAALLARAAEPFFTTKPVGEGTGLGLAMARGFAQQSGGGMVIASEQGRGTTVTLWLPAADGQTIGPPSAATDVEQPGDRVGRVLLVDDNALVRDVLAAELGGHGYAVTGVSGAAAALARLDAGESIDLLVSDLSMPEMDGLALIREARRRRPALPAILLTGYAGQAAALAMNGAISGLFSLVRKPIAAGQLAARAAALLESAAARAG